VRRARDLKWSTWGPRGATLAGKHANRRVGSAQAKAYDEGSRGPTCDSNRDTREQKATSHAEEEALTAVTAHHGSKGSGVSGKRAADIAMDSDKGQSDHEDRKKSDNEKRRTLHIETPLFVRVLVSFELADGSSDADDEQRRGA
jgi:hypothetical protein